ncbi:MULTISPECIES: hypothetical protein [Pasteurellaceae]|uniref:Uncharacterized protein n=1 Tax=Pasteurella atlantica TaxID=2827233 RepID=A0AAW8CN84_9PAST|nr:hypothetical protein [Pasteurella atlantica]MBR0573434.1 hypothetical protein [Pasteurella atlantica]MDP8039435.1 hypothetical protein [Pasteurella atlantica]MDP8041526.1 hypothetical protein [Pasteurella atlantica]MDP8043663.1 hypothetical protein [Pasteurella atlantica]MDP8045840.1 hypothetical protein [Pasteurella atlantica]
MTIILISKNLTKKYKYLTATNNKWRRKVKVSPRCIIILTISTLCILPFCFEWIIAEITTPIRCAMLGDKGVEIYLSKEQWRASRSDLDFSKISSSDFENNWIGSSEYHDLKMKNYKKNFKFKGQNYELWGIYPKFSITVYVNKTEAYDVFSKIYWLYYDNKLNSVVANSKDVRGYYRNYANMGLDHSSIKCNRDNDISMTIMVRNYFK